MVRLPVVPAHDAPAIRALTHHLRGLSEPATAMVLGLVCTLLAWWRVLPPVRQTIWAEDGQVFIEQAVAHHAPFHTLLHPYDGYLHLVPRLIAESVVFLAPVSRFALAINSLSVATAGAVAGTVYLVSAHVVPSRAARMALAATTVLTPVLAIEVLGNAANIHSLLLWLTGWILLARPRSWRSAAVLALVALACGLSEVQVVLFAPLLFAGLRERRTLPVKLAVATAAIAQLVTAMSTSRHPGGAVEPRRAAFRFITDVLATPWLGLGHAGLANGSALWHAVAISTAVPAVAAIIVVMRRGSRLQRTAVAAFVIAGCASWAAATVTNGTGNLAGTVPVRWSATPSMLLIAVAVIGAYVAFEQLGRRAAVTALLAAGVLLGSAITSFVPGTQTRRAGPEWPAGVAAAGQFCQAHATEAAVIPVAPQPRWEVHVPCSVVLRGQDNE